MLKKLLAVAATLLLGTGLSMASSSPAVASDPQVSGTAVCNPALGTYDITWHVQGGSNFANATATIVSARQSGVEITTTPSLVGVTASGASFTDGVQQNVTPGYYRLDVKVSWSTGAARGMFSTSGAVTASAAACVATAPVPTTTAKPAVVREVGAYLYKKLDPSANASGGNSGPQLLLEVRTGASWFTPTVALPRYVCGPGWAVQEDAVAYTAGNFRWPAMLDLRHGITIGTPLYASIHVDLDDMMDVPGCLEDPAMPTWTNEACNVGTVVGGSISVELDPGLVYSIDGPGGHDIDPVVVAPTATLPAGDYVVSVTARPGFELAAPIAFPFALTIRPATCVDLPPLATWDARASVTQPSCSPTGVVPGSVGVLFPPSAPDAVRYFIDRNLPTERELTSNGTQLSTGTYKVTAEPRDPEHTILAPASWTLSIGSAPTLCASVPTLPLHPPTPPLDPSAPAFDPPTLALDLPTLALDLPTLALELPTLAYTGMATAGALTLAGGLITIGFLALVVGKRRTLTPRRLGSRR